MSKKIINTIVEDSGKKSLNKLADAAIFEPTPTQQKLKTRFWERFGSGPFSSGHQGNVTGDMVSQVTNSRKVLDWWNNPGFREWFLDTNEETIQVKALFSLALRELERMITNQETQDSARINGIKLIMEINDKMPSRHKEKFMDEQIGKMDKSQLDSELERASLELLKRKGFKIVKEEVIDVKATKDKDKS